MQDEQHYPARVTALGPSTAVVMFTEYNNYEEVSFIHIVQTNCLTKPPIQVLLEDLLQKPY